MSGEKPTLMTYHQGDDRACQGTVRVSGERLYDSDALLSRWERSPPNLRTIQLLLKLLFLTLGVRLRGLDRLDGFARAILGRKRAEHGCQGLG